MNRSQRRASGYRAPSGTFEYPCTHCGTERLVCAISEFIGFNRRHPMPGLQSVLDALLKVYGPNTRASMCPGCFCVTTDLTGPHSD